MGSIRAKALVGVLVPLAVTLLGFAYIQQANHRRIMLESASESAQDLGTLVESSLVEAMLVQDRPAVQRTLDHLGSGGGVRSLRVVDAGAEIRAASPRQNVGALLGDVDPEAASCTAAAYDAAGAVTRIASVASDAIMRTCRPIENRPECQGCHDASRPYNGALISDISLAPLEDHLAVDLRRMLLAMAGALALGGTALALVVNRIVVQPVAQLTSGVRDLAKGNVRRRTAVKSHDELGELAESFNVMAAGLEDRARLEAQVRRRTAAVEQANADLKEKEAQRSLLLKQVIDAQEAERKRVARELHDELAQSLTGLVMTIDAATSNLGPDRAALQSQLSDTRRIVETALQQTRRLMLDLRPTMLDDLGLVPAIRWYIDSHLAPTGITVTLRTEGMPRRLTQELETALFRVAQEALNNVLRHSGAQKVQVALAAEDHEVFLRIRDDGVGFEPHAVHMDDQSGSGFGLAGMRERVEMLGGTITITSTPGAGTLVAVRVPLPPGPDGLS